jgi:hypothetical protein
MIEESGLRRASILAPAEPDDLRKAQLRALKASAKTATQVASFTSALAFHLASDAKRD